MDLVNVSWKKGPFTGVGYACVKGDLDMKKHLILLQTRETANHLPTLNEWFRYNLNILNKLNIRFRYTFLDTVFYLNFIIKFKMRWKFKKKKLPQIHAQAYVQKQRLFAN